MVIALAYLARSDVSTVTTSYLLFHPDLEHLVLITVGSGITLHGVKCTRSADPESQMIQALAGLSFITNYHRRWGVTPRPENCCLVTDKRRYGAPN